MSEQHKADIAIISKNDCFAKACLVARGDLQREGLDYDQTFAPVIKFVSLRVILAYAASKSLSVHHWDIVSAFLHGPIDMEIYMQQPQGFADGSNHVCRLKKAIYGLCQAARQFYLRFDEILRELGYTRLDADWALWRGPQDSIIAVHVDDIAAVGTTIQLGVVVSHLRKYLELTDFGFISKYLGMSICWDPVSKSFLLDQEDYILALITEYNLNQAHPVSTSMLVSERDKFDVSESPLLPAASIKRYQALIGSLLYLIYGTRPDISYSVIKLSQYASQPRTHHWLALKRVLRYLKGTASAKLVISYKASEGLVGYFDAALGDNSNRRSTCGYVFLLHGSPITWATRVQRTVALSTTEAEFMAGTEAMKEAMFIQYLIKVLFPTLPPAELRGDNQGALALAVNPVFHQRTKHIDIRQRFISEMVNAGNVTVCYVNTIDMLADGFTKPLTKERHIEHAMRMGLRFSSAIQSDTVDQSAMVTILEPMAKRRKLECDYCHNLFSDSAALAKHVRKLQDCGIAGVDFDDDF